MFVHRKRVTKRMPWRDEIGAEPWRQDYYQLVENYRPKGTKTPRQRVVLHLGRNATVDEALERWPADIRQLRSRATRDGDETARLSADALAEKLARLRELRQEGKA